MHLHSNKGGSLVNQSRRYRRHPKTLAGRVAFRKCTTRQTPNDTYWTSGISVQLQKWWNPRAKAATDWRVFFGSSPRRATGVPMIGTTGYGSLERGPKVVSEDRYTNGPLTHIGCSDGRLKPPQGTSVCAGSPSPRDLLLLHTRNTHTRDQQNPTTNFDLAPSTLGAKSLRPTSVLSGYHGNC